MTTGAEADDTRRATPAWVVTFADLMSLLMCFFVLLLSFAEIDAVRFKQIAAELAQAFGVQREVPVTETPQGAAPVIDSAVEQTLDEIREAKLHESVAGLTQVLAREIADGTLQLQRDRNRVVIRVEERGSFPSGSADMTEQFQALLARLSTVLTDLPGVLTIEGHTDDVPISTARFQSNWDLSAARASSVVNGLLRNPAIDAQRLEVQGFAETRPRADNGTPDGRALNRRVEIVIDLAEPLEAIEARARELIRQGRADLAFDLEWQTGAAAD